MLFWSLLITLASVYAAPAFPDPLHAIAARGLFQNCAVESINVPLRGINLTVPEGQKTTLITLGRGNQNYTCTSGAYVAAGAVADLYDMGCFFTATGLDAASFSAALTPIAKDKLSYPDTWDMPISLKHYFQKLGNATAAFPGFFATEDKIFAAKIQGVKALSNPSSTIDWLLLGALPDEGTLARSVFRIDTAGGQPPSSCSEEGSTLSVPYAAMYWFTK